MLSGILVVDKPAGPTSHDVVARVRRVLGIRRVGHAGTLDPDATGVLVLCVGDATRLIEYLMADDKVYEGTVVFGVGTDTDDAAGTVTVQTSAAHLTRSAVEEAARTFTGTIRQRPPVYSAVHIGGQRAYELARSGETVDLPERIVHIHRLTVQSFIAGERAEASFVVECSKGTYVRSLCRDWGARLGVPAHLASLRRIRSGWFHVDEAVDLDRWAASDEPARALRPLVDAVRGMPKVVLEASQLRRLTAGQPVPFDTTPERSGPIAVMTPAGDLAAVAVTRQDRQRFVLVPKKVLWKREQ